MDCCNVYFTLMFDSLTLNMIVAMQQDQGSILGSIADAGHYLLPRPLPSPPPRGAWRYPLSDPIDEDDDLRCFSM